MPWDAGVALVCSEVTSGLSAYELVGSKHSSASY